VDIESFWRLIDESRQHGLTTDEQISWLETKLKSAADQELIDFAVIVDGLFAKAYQFSLGYAFGYFAAEQFVTDDGFEYNCGWLILQGKEVYERVLRQPDNLADFSEVGECESLRGLPHREYGRRHDTWGCPTAPHRPIMPDEPQSTEELDAFDAASEKLYPRLSERFPTLQ
jgi:hypothetical protein